ncbi:hypothetical protein [Myxococcus sp. CA040A]|uniref:hypothetical protein n=1 Tax=Myxococcus sp. CA040A TaxID=2741738 RepID=UPI001C2CFA4E|nr:hypothetical protein [Myxococcus sp. CA040A]
MDEQSSYKTGDASIAWALLAEDGRSRDSHGATKYGVRHQHDNGRDHATDAYQEHVDSCCYWWAELKKAPSQEALEMFRASANLAFRARLYLYRRDGR